MTATVAPLPRQKSPTSELESKLLGAVLCAREPLPLFEASGLASEDFSDQRIKTAWGIARRLAYAYAPANATTVWSAGRTVRLFGDAELEWLQGLEATSVLDGPSFSAVAEDLRRLVKGTIAAERLEAIARQLRGGLFSPGRLTGELDAVGSILARDFAPDEDAAGDVVDLMDRWDKHELSGTESLTPTGIKILDDEIGGLPPRLVIIAGRPGVGKTALLGALIDAQLMANPDFRVMLFGLEDGTSWLGKRLMARDLGMKLRDVGSKARTAEEKERSQEVAARIHDRLKRVQVYRRDSITPGELVRRSTRAVMNHEVDEILVDHLGEVEHVGEEYWRQVAETVRLMRNFAIRHDRPVIILVHDTEEMAPGTKREGPPNPSKLAGGRSIDRKARMVLGLWQRGAALRLTVQKYTEGESGGTVEFNRLFESALIDPTGGMKVNLLTEAAQERRKTEEDGEERRRERQKKTAKENAQIKLEAKALVEAERAAKALVKEAEKKDAAQGELLQLTAGAEQPKEIDRESPPPKDPPAGI